MKKILFGAMGALTLALQVNGASKTTQTPKSPTFPAYIDSCIDGYVYRVFIDSHNQIIPTSIHQVMIKSVLHEKILPKQCTQGAKSDNQARHQEFDSK
ncbi:hypothetical protein BKH46_03460 [Helicobacter sp. 12S02634-8]|uniref:hypothetical protein n=1 Tax=Helicobacter sp. 12S02634-8 TaxID=1476199 RepID=UPI000BA7C7E9|nr:hypothetical protein [Helicobacter sp. 12S02634-8]PAF47502.1 hypothetical protein BKH46_03460 [Helicobacter sp. 12S02634-8]